MEKKHFCLNTALAVTLVVNDYKRRIWKYRSQYRLSSNSCGPKKNKKPYEEFCLNTALAVTLVVRLIIRALKKQ